MRTRRAPVPYGITPSVDLLPEAQRAERRLEHLIPKLLMIIIGSGLVAGLIFAAGFAWSWWAQQQLLQQQAENQRIAGELAQLSDVQATLNGVQLLTEQRASLTAGEILVMDIRDAAVAQLPVGSALLGMSATFAGATGSVDGSTTALPLCPAAAFTVELVIQTPSLREVTEFTRSLQQLKGYVCAISGNSVLEPGSGESGAGYRTTIEVSLNDEIIAHRFDRVETKQ